MPSSSLKQQKELDPISSCLPWVTRPVYPPWRHRCRIHCLLPRTRQKLIKKHLPKSEQTYKGHMDQERRNLQSAQPNHKIKVNPSEKIELGSGVRVKNQPDKTRSNEQPPTRTNLFICAIFMATEKITWTSPVSSQFNQRSAINMF